MSTRKYLVIIIAILTAMTIVAVIMIPPKNLDGRTQLSWMSVTVPVRVQQAEMFNRLNPDCQLTIEQGGDLTKNIVQCSANMGGDLIDFISEDNIQIYNGAGILWDITEQAKRGGFSPDTLPESVRPLVMDKVLDKNGKYVERQFTYPLNVFHFYIIYNKAIFDRLGVPYPSEDLTWDEYIDLSRKLTVTRKDSKVPDIFGAAGADFMTILWEKGGDLLNSEGTRATLDTPQAIAAMQFYHDLFFKYQAEPTKGLRAGVVSTGDGISSSSSNLALFGNGQLAMTWGARWYLMLLRAYQDNHKKMKEQWEKENPGKPYTGPELRYGACQIPRFKDGPRFVATGGRTVGINANSKNRERALKFLAFAAGPEYNQSICEISDCKPPNKNFYALDGFLNRNYPDEKPVHEMSLKAVPYGRMSVRSPFIDNGTLKRLSNKLQELVRTKKELTPAGIAALCREINNEINLTIARNIKRDPKLLKLYRQMLKQKVQPIVYDLDKI